MQQPSSGSSMLGKLQAESLRRAQVEEDAMMVPPKVTHRVEDVRNLNSRSDLSGRPLDRLDIRNTSVRTDAAGRPIGQGP